jgi:ElaB/YqjD/DUF883 family membrane-anchored ribosome-binding protein
MNTTTTHEDNRRPEEIEDDIERTRAHVGATIEAIQSKLTPGQMMDEALGWLRDNTGVREFGSNLGRNVRDNPMPVALIGLGVAWMMVGGGRPAMPRRDWSGLTDGLSTRRRPTATYSTDDTDLAEDWGGTGTTHDDDRPGMASRMGTAASDAGQRLRDTASGTAGRVRETASGAADRVRESVSGASERAKALAHEASTRLTGMRDGARMRAGDATERTRMQARRAREQTMRLVDEQPLVIGALGLAIGAALGAMLPSTRREDEWLGEVSDDLTHSAKDLARDGMHGVAESAQRVAQTAREEVERAIDRGAEGDDAPSTGGASGSSASRGSSTSSGMSGSSGSSGMSGSTGSSGMSGSTGSSASSGMSGSSGTTASSSGSVPPGSPNGGARPSSSMP